MTLEDNGHGCRVASLFAQTSDKPFAFPLGPETF